MAQAVFRPGQTKTNEEKVMVPLVRNFQPEEEVEEEVVVEYTGPSAEELRQEAEDFKLQWEVEKQKMIDEAKQEAEKIIKNAEDAAFAEVKRQSDLAAEIKAAAEKEADSIIEKAKADAELIMADVEAQRNSVAADAKESGYKDGHDEGYNDGKAEADRLIQRMHKMVDAVMQRREAILRDTETQIVELVILMSRKVIKIISESQKNVIMANVLAALKKVRSRGNVTLRVNLEDVKLTTEHVDEFIKHVENVQGITVLEDSSVDRGGCIVDTDFGAIDARISSQLTELENKIIEVSPIKNIKQSTNLAADS